MAVFYILPPRPLFGEYLKRLLQPYLPGLTLDRTSCVELFEAIASASLESNDIFLVHRDDLPDDSSIQSNLIDGYGADPGDKIIQVGIGSSPNEPRITMINLAA